MIPFVNSLALFVEAARLDAEVEGYFGMLLNITWEELTEIRRETGTGPTEVHYLRDGHQEWGLSWIGTYPGTSLDLTRVANNEPLLDTILRADGR